MKLYSWKDVERCFLLSKKIWKKYIKAIDFAPDYVYLSVKEQIQEAVIDDIIEEIFKGHYDSLNHLIKLDESNRKIEVIVEQIEDDIFPKVNVPLFKNIIYNDNSYLTQPTKKLSIPVIAFHSYKGGVGRTLTLLAFAKAWTRIFENNDKKNKLLIIDSDIEAPGLTWLTDDQTERFSYLDLLDVVQDCDNIDNMVKEITNKMTNSIISIDGVNKRIDHFLLPTYRYKEQLLDLYASPSSIVNRKDKQYILAEVLSRLAKTIGAAAVLVDLRAGFSEYSAPLLFDKRVKKYIVTSTSMQSIHGSMTIMEYLGRGLEVDENTYLPEYILGMIPADLIGKPELKSIEGNMLEAYDVNIQTLEQGLLDNVLTEVEFASELIHLSDLKQIMSKLEDRDISRKMIDMIKKSYIEKESNDVLTINREELLKKVHKKASEQVTADANDARFGVLLTNSVKSIKQSYKVDMPCLVILGAKGAGKTFLYQKMVKTKTWSHFLFELEDSDTFGDEKSEAIFFPILMPKAFLAELIKNSINYLSEELPEFDVENSICYSNENKILKTKSVIENEGLWLDFWEKLILESFGKKFNSLKDVDDILGRNNKRIILLIDGLEEIFKSVVRDDQERMAISILVQNIVNNIKMKYKNIGIIVFMRYDMAQNAIIVNWAQFEQQYKKYKLEWSANEALRLVVWLFQQSDRKFFKENIPIEQASDTLINRYLTKIWGTKLGRVNSNEAYTSRWVLAALSDFYGHLQARDMVRFIQYATQKSTGKAAYDDRYLMPVDIRNAVAECSKEKLKEVKQEYGNLKETFDVLESLEQTKKVLPFYSKEIGITSLQEKEMTQVGFLQNIDGMCYIPEILRHGLNFRYKKGARPKVLSLLLKDN